MGNTNKTKLTTLKCANCGSSVFEQNNDDTYKCCYCGSISKDDNAEKQSFIKFLNSKSATQSKIKIVKHLIDKNEFYKNAISHIALAKHSPEDVLNSKFEEVKLRYNYFLIVRAEFKIATLSNSYFNEIAYNTSQNSRISINSEKQTEEDVVNEYISVCSPLHPNAYEGQSEKFYKDMYGDYEPPATSLITVEQLEKDNIKLPSKTAISKDIDRIINETKTELLQTRRQHNIRIMHKITEIELFIVPEYYLSYEYKNEKFEVTSFGYDLNIMGTMPDDSEKLFHYVTAKTAFYPITSIIVSGLGAIFGLIHYKFLRYSSLIGVDIMLILIMGVVFASTFFIDKIITKSILTKRYNAKKLKLKEFLNNNSPTNTIDFLNSFEGGC